MPPRKSSRSTRASIEPQETAKPAPSKRKRPEPAEPVVDQENIKPAGRTRRSTSLASLTASASAPKKSTRSKKSLEEVIEIDDEDEEREAPPPVRKKPRPSLEVDGLEEVEPEDVKPAVGRRASTRKPRSKAVLSAGANEEETPSTGRKPASAKRGGRASTRTSSRTATRVKKEPSAEPEDEMQDSDASDGERMVKVKKERRKPASRVINSDDDAEEEEEVLVSVGPRTSRKPRINKLTSQAEAPEVEVQPEETPADEIPTPPNENIESSDERSEEVPALATVEAQAPRHATPEEEEHSLLDRPVSPDLQSQSQVQPTIPEEPQGPKPRLVIHKMALVNFKSYAGRQEIGPFHKVISSDIVLNDVTNSATFSRFQLSWAPMAQESRILLTPSCLFLVTVQVK